MATPEIDIDAISEALNDKMDRDLKNRSNDSGLRKLRESYVNSNDWYKIFTEIQQDGTVRTWCEQGGFAEPGTLISLLIPYADTTYTLTVTPNGGTNGSSATTCNTYNVTSTSFYFTTASNVYSAYWKAEGYLVLNETIPTPITPVPDAPTPIETTELQLLQQQITVLQNEVNTMLGRIDWDTSVNVTFTKNTPYTCLSDGYVTFTQFAEAPNSSGSAYTGTSETRINNKTIATHLNNTGHEVNPAVGTLELNTLIPVSQGDIISAYVQNNNLNPTGTFVFFPQKAMTVSNS